MIWRTVLAAPHRPLFLAGIVQALVAMGIWLIDVGGRYAGLWQAPVLPLPPPWLHASMLLFGVFAFFVFGFILTAGPRWQGMPDTPPGVFRPAGLLMAAGWFIADIGLMVPGLLGPGLALAMAGWAVALRFIWRVALGTDQERRHILLMATALTLGLGGLSCLAVFAAGGPPVLGAAAVALGLWGFLLPAFAIVIHRMLPFFSSGAIRGYVVHRPFWALAVVLAASGLHGIAALADAATWIWPADLAAAVAALRLTWLWRLRESFAARIVAVLHVGFAWCGIGFALLTIHGLLLWAGGTGLGQAPVHALTIGFFSSTVVGMGSRVTLGHSGKPVAGDGVMWGAFWMLQLAAVLRITGEFVVLPGILSPTFLAALLWLCAFGAWAAKYAPNLWRPRADGRSG
ncbi:MAG: NnrS family protein [Sterolibacteriaceae bacterium MAG5]|nr:NnrS family protein [Candidatus Nitricoxidireducens bremensis]